MLPRISLRRSFLYLLVLTCFLFVVLNVHQPELWARTMAVVELSPAAGPTGSPGPGSAAAPGPVPGPGPGPEPPAPPAPDSAPLPRWQRVDVDPEKILAEMAAATTAGGAASGSAAASAAAARAAAGADDGDETAAGAAAGAGASGASGAATGAAAAARERERPWYMAGGTRRPVAAARSRKTGRRLARVWPQEAPDSDRITNQLMFVPPEPAPGAGAGPGQGDAPAAQAAAQRLKKILIYNGLGSWASIKPGRDAFLRQKCPVDTCTITANKAEAADADLILYKDHFVNPGVPRPPRQVWVLYFLECPYHTQHVKFNDVFNWTATYRRDSDIVAPYERWAYYDEHIKQNPHMDRNYAANKTKKVAWFVSNCGARNRRLQYAHELQKYIQVDIYGACGTKRCPRSSANKCLQMLDRDYKFYLAFENSNCKDYITEKFYVNGLGRNVLPIVMGARPEDYARNAPYRSYIHVDEFDSARELAAYLLRLDADDDLYNTYFRWKGTGEFINTYFFCRLCAMLHDDFPVKSYRDVNDWWRGPGTCTGGSWRKAMKSTAPGG